MTWKMRLSIFLSILWLLLTVTIGLSERNGSFIVGMGLAPVLFLWGVWWVITGGKPRPTPILPATEIPKALSTPLMLSPESSRLSQNKSKHFIKRHWRGEYSLSRSYWIHGVLVTVILTLLLTLLGESLDYTTHPWLLVYHLFGVWLFSYIVAIWQLVGTWRSAGNARILEPHSQWPNIAQFLLFMAAISLTIMPFNKAVPQIIGAWEAASEATDSSAYRVIFLNDGTELEINGTFVFGLSDRIQVHLEANPNVKLIHLNSTGGRIAEAKKLRQLIHQKELSTYTSMGCLSACTFAYVGGKSRYLRKGANVGFHRPSFPGIDDTEMQSEVDQLKTAFLKLGVARSFTERVFSTPPNEMWYPSIDDLTSARFVTNITDGGLFGASAYGAYVDRKAAEKGLLETLTYRAIQNAHPQAFQEMLDDVISSVKAGRTQGKIDEMLYSKVRAILARSLPLASDSSIVAFTRARMGFAKAALEGNDSDCYDWLMGNNVSITNGAEAKLSGALADVITTAATSPLRFNKEVIPEEDVNKLTQSIQRTHPDDLVAFQKFKQGTSLSPKEKRIFCNVIIALFEEALKLPPNRRGPVLRGMNDSNID